MQINKAHLLAAVSIEEPPWSVAYTGFLNRQTGEIMFVYEGVGEDDDDDLSDVANDDELAAEYVFNRAEVEANPSAWIEIPKYVRNDDDASDDASDRSIIAEEEREFAMQFLNVHGIDSSELE